MRPGDHLGDLSAHPVIILFNVNISAGAKSFCLNFSAGADGFMDVSLSSPADMFRFDLKARCTCVSSQKKAAQKYTKPLQYESCWIPPLYLASRASFNVNTDFHCPCFLLYCRLVRTKYTETSNIDVLYCPAHTSRGVGVVLAFQT